MDIEIANKIVAEYMGCGFGYEEEGNIYWRVAQVGEFEFEQEQIPAPSDSLDTLVPVWRKLGNLWTRLDFMWDENGAEIGYMRSKNSKCTRDEITIQQAACIATAKAIKELT